MRTTDATKQKYIRVLKNMVNHSAVPDSFFENNRVGSHFKMYLTQSGIISKVGDFNSVKVKILDFEKEIDKYIKFRNKKFEVSRKNTYERNVGFLTSVLDKMPNVFTGRDFYDKIRRELCLKKNQRPPIDAQILTIFYEKNLEKLAFSTYKKKETDAPIKESQLFFTSTSTEEYTQECISHLKSLGYKIMKPINQWEEI